MIRNSSDMLCGKPKFRLEKYRTVVRSTFELQESVEECSLSLAEYIPVCLAEQCMQIKYTTGKVFGQCVRDYWPVLFEAETTVVAVFLGGQSLMQI
jgi:hypothetical protein